MSPATDAHHWQEPGAHPVVDGVHRIPLPLPMDGLRAVNVYAIETADGLVMIDGGWAVAEAREQLEESLRVIDHKVADVTRFLVTHVHRDHYTQAVTVRREFGSHVSLGLGDRASLEVIRNPGAGVDPYATRMRSAGAPDIAERWSDFTRTSTPDLSLWELPDTWLDGDQTVAVGERALQAVHTPGHTQGHYVFADPDAAVLFAGDHVLPTITPSIGFEPAPAEQPLGDFLASLTKVRSLPDMTLLPAHGPVVASSHRRIDELLAHHDDRLEACRLAVAGGAQTAYDVARRLPWTRRQREFDELDLFNASLAVMETLAHLDLLAARGALAGSTVEEATVFGLPG